VDEQTPGVEVRRRRSRAEAGQLVAEYEASGLSQVEFCQKQGLRLATLARYRKRQTQGSPAAGNRARVEMWLEQKIKQIEQDRETQQARAKRAEVDAGVHRLATRAALLRGHEDLVRRHIYKARGISVEED